MTFEFYYGNDGEQFRFFRLPKALFEDDLFRQISTEGKILYSLMLDRMSLSRKNGWVDEQNRVFIEYRVDDIMLALNSSKNTCTKVLNELANFGLIQRQRRGQGKPVVYYVMNFISGLTQSVSASDSNRSKAKKREPSAVPKRKNQEAQKLDFLDKQQAVSPAECAKKQDETGVSEPPDAENPEAQNLGVLNPNARESRLPKLRALKSQSEGVSSSYTITETDFTETEGVRLSETPSTQNAEDDYFDVIRTAFETSCPSLKAPVPVSQWSRKRKQSLLDKHLSVADFEAVCSQTEASDFLTGRKAGKDGTMFLASFAWVLKNWESVAEGSYANYQKPVNSAGRPSFDLDAYERDSMFDTQPSYDIDAYERDSLFDTMRKEEKQA